MSRRERLGSLPARPGEDLWYLDDPEDCAAKVLARSGNARRLCFVGRSPASICDLLTGALEGTSWRDRLVRVPLSLRCRHDGERAIRHPHLRRQLEANLSAAGLHPSELQRGKGVVAFVDLVAQGGTFANLLAILEAWTAGERAQWDVVRTKLRWIAITMEQRPRPGRGRWYDDVPGFDRAGRSTIAEIPIRSSAWSHFGNDQPKVERSFPPERWAEADGPVYADRSLDALATAVALVEHGRTATARRRLALGLAAAPSVSEPWARSLAQELRGVHQSRRGRRQGGLGRPWVDSSGSRARRSGPTR